MVNKNMLSTMKQSAYLINTARGPLVNEKDLVDALVNETIKGAAIDTFEVEPPAADNPLYGFSNVVLTMHTAGNSDASLINMATVAASNVLAVLRNEFLDERMIVSRGASRTD